jgi:hypothetical protein
LADELADACQKLTLPVRWTRQDGEPVALVDTHDDSDSDKTRFFIDTIELGDSELYVAGHTERSAPDPQQPRTAAIETPGNEVALDDYELRLTPRHKDGPLQIARRTAPADKKATESSEPASKRPATD